MNGKPILEEILENKRLEISERQKRISLDAAKQSAGLAPVARNASFDGSLSLIAEVKKKSPSQGDFGGASADPAAQAAEYEGGGAAAISVLTDERFFGGTLDDLSAVRAAVSIPVLCKDFILSQYQIYEARAAGADLLLLIVGALDDETLIDLKNLCVKLGMTPLVEVHDQHELARAIASGSGLIGINNRDLSDFSVDLVTTEYLAPLVPDEIVIVSESGIKSRDDVVRVQQAGATVILVGEALLRSNDPKETIKGLLS